MAKAKYTSKAETLTIKATSRVSVKVKETYYTLEYTEERMIPDVTGIDLKQERKALWDTVNTEVDNQVQDIYNAK